MSFCSDILKKWHFKDRHSVISVRLNMINTQRKW